MNSHTSGYPPGFLHNQFEMRQLIVRRLERKNDAGETFQGDIPSLPFYGYILDRLNELIDLNLDIRSISEFKLASSRHDSMEKFWPPMLITFRSAETASHIFNKTRFLPVSIEFIVPDKENRQKMRLIYSAILMMTMFGDESCQLIWGIYTPQTVIDRSRRSTCLEPFLKIE